ncbi:uncharacterized protein EI90DRAFT_3145821 [Cantharellus anzutake]|uniref:uncharacterized protein n=1 Tax=Cantharellus anzutake TaxID=1750568 RepID=UPI001908B4C9|nr:uncharacterized protein EI90DRAFT_3146950 [Cantharellus anzutake]XP_038915277.1 uncharacterized protein EI90DRAFT_3145821 [Cantharellus anzutake]KAF8323647.1 hypothetical protein EI90DRAFT_3146950 [Cantharellus anzutake]KAF8330056.1 hypothetical protein EI90DRAFT_3145821 [Cantharellus anzutake]
MQVCVITGAARGLGYSFAEAFIESGSTRVALVDLSPDATEAAATNLSEWATEKGIGPVEVVAYPLNVTDERAVQESMGKIVEKWGKIDCILTAAGVVHNYSSFEYPSERMKSLYNVNVHGSFYCARAAAQHMMALGTGGSIIFISSMSGRIVNWPQLQMPYNASKAAVRQMAASLACEWAEHQIRVNAISPGYIETSMTGPIVEKYGRGMLDEWIRGTPMKRLGLPEDLKGAAVLLASDASKFTTGSELVIDGGYTCL